MRLSIRRKSNKYNGYFLDIDRANEVFTLLDPKAGVIKSFGMDEVIDSMIEQGYKDLNRRMGPRAPLSIRVKYTDPGGKTYESITSNIGGGGLFIESLSPLPLGATVSLKFSLPDHPKETISADGEVVWVRQKFEHILYYPGMGVRFLKISEKDKGKLLTMIGSLNEMRGDKLYLQHKSPM